MKLAIISDTHFGDPTCSMFSIDPATGKSKYDDFCIAAGDKNDYLILLGDIFDFSIASYQEAYDTSHEFFKRIANDNIAKEIIYVPGNHDFSAWHILMHEINVINRIKVGKPVEEQRWSCPAVLKDGPNRDEWLTLPNVSINPDAPPKYGKIFLTDLTKVDDNPPLIPFNVAYPNIYLITDEKEGVLLTHGHYLESVWSFTGEFSKIIAREDLKLCYGDALNIEEYVNVNFPLCELISSGVGQAGPLTKIVRAIQQEVKSHQLDRIKKYFDRFQHYADKLLSFEWYKFYKEIFTDIMLNELDNTLFNTLKDYGTSRYDTEFINKDEVRQRFLRFYNASTMETCLLNEKYGDKYRFEIPPLTKVIFGHIHEPIPNENVKEPLRAFIESCSRGVTLYITGGWLWRPGSHQEGKVNAAVYTYESKVGFQFQIV